MAKKKQELKKADEVLIDVVEVREQAGDFFERNRLYVLGGIGLLVLVLGGWFAYNQFYKVPKQQEAVEQMFQAQIQFERDSFQLALINPGGGYLGFLDIIDNYGGTPAANTAKYYAGVSYLHIGQEKNNANKEFEAAISYLKDFDAKGDVMPIVKNGALGDAYAELKDFSQAMSYYKKAVSSGDNQLLTPYYLKKVGMLNEKNGDAQAALNAYEQIKNEYPNSPEARDIEKYIARVTPKG
ncbi:MAG: tetratricopeptide repeat protein [Saprospiraceae bacterium]